jgi:glutathione synthase/RimK-type ligase-like ATP-grasp enzyme
MNGVAVPLTAYSPSRRLSKGYEKIAFPAVLKAVDGKKGRSNYLVNERSECDALNQESASGMLLQRYIPNDRDYRVLVLNYKDVVVTERKRKDNTTHLNNVSAGGDELLVEDYSDITEAIELSIRAAKVLAIEVAGVDVVIDANTGKPYIMEVNRAPELTLEAELSGYFSMIKHMLLETTHE